MKLSKAERKIQEECDDILQKETLTYQEKEFIIENWHEGTYNNNAAAGAFNAKIKAFRTQFRGVRNIGFFLFRLTQIYA